MPFRAIKQKKEWQGRRMTRQRQMIFENLAGRQDHPDIETLHAAVKAKSPGLSLQTVYRTISLFENLGMVRRLALWKGRIRYDADTQPHSHFLCETCGSVLDVETPNISWLELGCQAGHLGTVRSFELLLKGPCHPCLEMNQVEMNGRAEADID